MNAPNKAFSERKPTFFLKNDSLPPSGVHLTGGFCVLENSLIGAVGMDGMEKVGF